MPEYIHTKFQDNLTKFRDFGILGGKSPPGGRMGGISENWRGHSLSNGVQSIHTEFQGNRTIFQDGGISPPGGERGGISENGHNSYSSNVPENIHYEF